MVDSELVLGLGGTVDYEIEWDSSVLESLVDRYRIRGDELTTTQPIASERDLAISVLAFLETGAGGERYVASSGIVEQFAARFVSRVTLGGTPVRAALAMHALGIPSTVHLVSIDDTVRRLLPGDTGYLCSAEHDSLDPHLIVQFPAGAEVRVGDQVLRAPHPNRLIYSNDPPNRELLLSSDLGSALRDAKIFLVSGFNSMQDASALDERLRQLRAHMRSLPADALVFYEDAGFHQPALGARVRESLLELLDVYSMNEDEWEAHLGHRVDLLDADAVQAALHELHALIPARVLVVHTRYWSLAFGADAGRYRSALSGGITMASTRYRLGDGFTAQDYLETGLERRNAEGERMAVELAELMPEVAVVAAFTLHPPKPTTIGLGDTFVGGFIAALAPSR